jgi:hypothetical protein
MAEGEQSPGLVDRARTRLAEVFVGEDAQVVDTDRLEIMEAEARDRRILRRELEDLAYMTMDYFGGNEQDVTAVERRRIVQKTRIAWQSDPQIGGAVDLYNDFTLGRGVPKPKARDPKVQDVIDEAWDDEDNKLVLTEYESQLQFNTDLSLQCNVFLLAFTGGDGKVKLSVLDHDTVERIIQDKDNRRRHLWYMTRPKQLEWDFRNHTMKPKVEVKEEDRIQYFQHWSHEPSSDQKPDAKFIGKGRVYHVAINKTGEMTFGHPIFHRVLRWSSAFNSLMEARLDMARAAAAFVMKRKVKGTRNQVEKQATQALSRRSQLGRSLAADEVQPGPGSASILNENEGVEHETFSLDTKAQNANTDGQMIRSQVSAGTHFPQHYLGDIGSANLATATSMELPVLKAVESRQEIIEGVFRWFTDYVIDEAVKKGRLDPLLDDEEYAEQKKDQEQEGTEEAPPLPSGQPGEPAMNGDGGTPASTTAEEASTELDTSPVVVDGEQVGEEGEGENEDRKRDLSYDFSLPSPLRRMLQELVSSVSEIARTFDPNGTNIELSRTLLSVVLGEGLEMADPGEVVEKVFPPGYQDPAMKALQAAGGAPGAPGGPPPGGGNPFGGNSAGNGAPDPEQNPYGAPQESTLPENVREAREEAARRDRELLARGGIPLEESILGRIKHAGVREAVKERLDKNGTVFDEAMGPVRDLAKGETEQ